MTRHHLITNLALIGTALALALANGPVVLAQQSMTPANPTVKEIHAGETVHAARLPGHVYLRDVNDPDSIVWDRIPTYRTFLTAAPPVHRSTALRFNPKEGQNLYFQVARTAERLYVRLRWQDPTKNRKTTVNEFRDGAAVEFALHGVDTSYMMGSGPRKPVNIWYWHPDHDEVEDLAAGGYGSTTSLPQQSVSGQSTYHVEQNSSNNEWHLVMSRKFDSPGEYQVSLQKGVIPVAFAVWQGADGQRDGDKRVSNGWILVDVVPTPLPHAQKGETKAPAVKAKDAPKSGQSY